jgi:hypothetical protein
VLFALFINKLSEDAKTNRYKENALYQIKAEIIDNQNILKNWMETHNEIVENLAEIIETKNDSIQILAKNKSYLPMQVILYKKSLIDKPLSNSAWNSAQSVGVLSEFDFETLQSISQTYELQQYIMDTSIDRILERYFLQSTDVDNANNLLIELKLRFQNLQGQEFMLERIYKETIELL